MINIFGYWDAMVASAAFAVLLVLAWVLLRAPRTRKAKEYLSGEEMEYSTPVKGFYSSFEKTMHAYFKNASGYQSSSINDYVAYIVIFSAIISLLLAAGRFAGLI